MAARAWLSRSRASSFAFSTALALNASTPDAISPIVVPTESWQHDIEIAGGQFPHRRCRPAHSLGDTACHQHRCRAGDQQDDAGDLQRAQSCAPGERIEIVDVDARDHHPAPRLETGGVGQFRYRLVGTGPWPAVAPVAAAGLLHQSHRGLHIASADRRATVAAIELRRRGMHHDALLHVDDPEVFALAEAKRGDPRRSALVRFVCRDRALLGGVVLVLDDAEGQVRHIGQLGALLLVQARAHLIQGDEHDGEQAGDAQSHHGVNLVRDRHPQSLQHRGPSTNIRGGTPTAEVAGVSSWGARRSAERCTKLTCRQKIKTAET